MTGSLKCFILYIAINFFLLPTTTTADGFYWDSLNIFGTWNTNITNKVSNIINNNNNKMYKLPVLLNSSDIFEKGINISSTIGKKITNLPSKARNISKLIIESTVQEVYSSASLNCFGMPIKLISKTLENIFLIMTNAEDVRFYFSSRNKPEYTIVNRDNQYDLTRTDFQITRATILLVHGFMSSGMEKWMEEMKDALLKYNDVNVIVTDWQKGSNTWNYVAAATNTRVVGRQIAKLFEHIKQDYLKSGVILDFRKIHFIGHSLGAHISGHAAYLIKMNQPKNVQYQIIGRITGLDPAQPCFTIADLTLKLDRTDATYVDIIHTNAKQTIYLGLGLPYPLGHIDFYPNGGKVQLGCSEIDTSIWSFLLLPKNCMIEETICSHGRSHVVMTESILDAITGNCSFLGHKWDRTYENIDKLLINSCNENICPKMGIHSIDTYPKTEGIYFVPTGRNSPFCVVGNDDKPFIQKQLTNDEKVEKNIITNIAGTVLGDEFYYN